jgi:hypothetical protein
MTKEEFAECLTKELGPKPQAPQELIDHGINLLWAKHRHILTDWSLDEFKQKLAARKKDLKMDQLFGNTLIQ